MAAKRIDEEFATCIQPAVAKDEVPHVSVLAFALIPLLVSLGSKLDDTVETIVFDQHRDTEDWESEPSEQVVCSSEPSWPMGGNPGR